MMVSFSHRQGEALEGSLVYDEPEYSFRFTPGSPLDLAERAGKLGLTSISIGTLQIEVGVATCTVLFAWGLHPHSRWLSHALDAPDPKVGIVRVNCPGGLQRGVSIGLAEVGAWTTLCDRHTGWIRVAIDSDLADEEQVLVATGIVLGLRQKSLVSVWLHPVFSIS
jgi:hypothetical protein